MTYFDISLPLSEALATYPGNQPFERESLKTIGADEVELSKLTLGTHSGTHIDAPRHFVKGGKGVDQIDLTRLIGSCIVIDCTYVEEFIRTKDFEGVAIEKGSRIIIKTRNSDFVSAPDFTPNYVSLTLEAAQFLANKEIALIGIDYLSIEVKGSFGHPVHKALLKRDIIILEGINLANVEAGIYQLLCLPLLISKADGAPCRALLLR